MRMTSFTFNPFGLISFAFIILLMVGTLPFTGFWVGLTILLCQIELTLTWDR